MTSLSVLGLVVAVLTATVRAGVKYPDCTNGPLKSNLVCDTSAAPAARASALVAAMSNSDKLANLVKYIPPFVVPFPRTLRSLIDTATRPASPSSA